MLSPQQQLLSNAPLSLRQKQAIGWAGLGRMVSRGGQAAAAGGRAAVKGLRASVGAQPSQPTASAVMRFMAGIPQNAPLTPKTVAKGVLTGIAAPRYPGLDRVVRSPGRVARPLDRTRQLAATGLRRAGTAAGAISLAGLANKVLHPVDHMSPSFAEQHPELAKAINRSVRQFGPGAIYQAITTPPSSATGQVAHAGALQAIQEHLRDRYHKQLQNQSTPARTMRALRGATPLGVAGLYAERVWAKPFDLSNVLRAVSTKAKEVGPRRLLAENAPGPRDIGRYVLKTLRDRGAAAAATGSAAADGLPTEGTAAIVPADQP